MFEIAVAFLLSVPTAQQWYPGAKYELPDGTAIVSPALPPSDKRGMTGTYVAFVDSPYVDSFCKAPLGTGIIACTYMEDPEGAWMVLPNPCEAKWHNDTYAVILCHEKGHVLGWQHD